MGTCAMPAMARLRCVRSSSGRGCIRLRSAMSGTRSDRRAHFDPRRHFGDRPPARSRPGRNFPNTSAKYVSVIVVARCSRPSYAKRTVFVNKRLEGRDDDLYYRPVTGWILSLIDVAARDRRVEFIEQLVGADCGRQWTAWRRVLDVGETRDLMSLVPLDPHPGVSASPVYSLSRG